MNILIAGGTGLIGTRICEIAQNEGHNIGILTRKIPETKLSNISYFLWNPTKHEIEPSAFNFAEVIINLAGASIIGKKWSEEYKTEILNSRIDATNTIVKHINNQSFKCQKLINASAIGIYGFDNKDLLTETSAYDTNFLAQVCVKWEEEAEKMDSQLCDLMIIRIGIALSTKDGALKEIINPMKFGFGTCLGSGNQITSWIHIDDLAHLFLWGLRNQEIKGVYLGTSPNPVSNKVLTQEAAKVLSVPLWIPNVPGFALKWMLGESAGAVIGSINAPGKKALNERFYFEFPEIKAALVDLIKNKK